MITDLRSLPEYKVETENGVTVERKPGPDGYPVYSLTGFRYAQIVVLYDSLKKAGTHSILRKTLEQAIEG